MCREIAERDGRGGRWEGGSVLKENKGRIEVVKIAEKPLFPRSKRGKENILVQIKKADE